MKCSSCKLSKDIAYILKEDMVYYNGYNVIYKLQLCSSCLHALVRGLLDSVSLEEHNKTVIKHGIKVCQKKKTEMFNH